MGWFDRYGARREQPTFRAAGDAVAEWHTVNPFGAMFHPVEPSPIRVGPESGVSRIDLVCLDQDFKEVPVVITPSATQAVITQQAYYRINAGRVTSPTHARSVVLQMQNAAGEWVDTWMVNNYMHHASTYTIPAVGNVPGDPWRVLEVSTDRAVKNGTFDASLHLEIRRPGQDWEALRPLSVGRTISGFDYPLFPGTDIRFRLVDIVKSTGATGVIVSAYVTLEKPPG